MEFNICGICGAKDGRAGLLINGNCLNCNDTINCGRITIYNNLIRTDEEIEKTMNILKKDCKDICCIICNEQKT